MDASADVFVVEHLHVQDDDQEDTKLIGVYSSKAAAEEAVERLRLKPGFRDTPKGFTIDLYRLNEDNWTEGFITVKHQTPSTKDE